MKISKKDFWDACTGDFRKDCSSCIYDYKSWVVAPCYECTGNAMLGYGFSNWKYKETDDEPICATIGG